MLNIAAGRGIIERPFALKSEPEIVITKRGRRSKLGKQAVEELLYLYAQRDVPIRVIAEQCGVSLPLVCTTAKQAGVPMRGRGRTRLLEPSQKHHAMLPEAWNSSYHAAGLKFGVTRQAIWTLAKRWRTWAENRLGQRQRGYAPRSTIASGGPATAIYAPPSRQPKSRVVSFRLSLPALAALRCRLVNCDSSAARSEHDVARLIVLKFLEGDRVPEINSQQPSIPDQHA